MGNKKKPFSLEGKNIIVTGASSGIGRQCSITCSRMGARVALLGRDLTRLEETLDMMDQYSSHTIFSVDLLDYEKIAETIDKIVQKHGRIDGLINGAGISTTLPLNSLTPRKMEEFFRTNVTGAVNLTQHAVKQTHFSKEGGSVIFISSVMGVAGENGKTLYSMTKGALISATRSMAIELASRRIRVNAVSPGVVESPMSKNAVYSRNEESLNRIKTMHPLGLGKPEDVANACLFLLSDEARWITGTNLIVDGGYLAR
jgi:NAD(P)-dependent dehydrogenase (short-subunit alcohol dehydrogenase family)